MTFYELIDVAQSVAARIDVQWGFFLTFHLALLGGIVYVDRPLSKMKKGVAVVLYSVFAIMSFRLLRLQQSLLEKAYTDIVALQGDGCCAGSQLMEFYVAEVNAGFGARIVYVAVGLHLLAFIVVLVSIISDQSRTGSARTSVTQ